jgi:Uma2 family endonuclease
MAVATGLTIEDYEALPEALARGHELVKGELVEVSGNIGEHNQLRFLIERVLAEYLEKHELGGLVLSEQEYRFDEETTRAPDVSYFSEAKKRLYNPDRRVQLFVPDLAIEIASPNDRFGLVIDKLQLYLTAGVPEAWLFWPSMRAVFLCVTGRDPQPLQEFKPASVPGLSVPIGELFDRLV